MLFAMISVARKTSGALAGERSGGVSTDSIDIAVRRVGRTLVDVSACMSVSRESRLAFAFKTAFRVLARRMFTAGMNSTCALVNVCTDSFNNFKSFFAFTDVALALRVAEAVGTARSAVTRTDCLFADFARSLISLHADALMTAKSIDTLCMLVAKVRVVGALVFINASVTLALEAVFASTLVRTLRVDAERMLLALSSSGNALVNI